jgi:hypothetical protein
VVTGFTPLAEISVLDFVKKQLMKVMKNYNIYFASVILLIMLTQNLYSQNWGVSFGGSTEKVLFGDMFYKKESHYFHIGLGYQVSDAKGEEKSERKSNYGLSTSGSGDKFYTVDFGYGYQIIDTLEIFVELSVGQKKYYTNYIDNRFKDGGYHMIDKDELIAGFGLGGSYSINKQFKIFASYNTIRKLGIGIRYIFYAY